MSCTQNNVFNTTVRFSTTCSLSRVTSVHMAVLCIPPSQIPKHHKMPRIVKTFPKCRTCAPICFFGGKGNTSGESKVFSWDSLKDALRGLKKEKTIQDMLRDQMRQREFGDVGGDGNPPGSGGGGGGFDGTEDEGFAGFLDETLQVVMATLAFIFVYIYIIKGSELAKLGRDYITYLLGGVPSMRLKKILDKWKRASDNLSWTPEKEGDDRLVRSILMTPTWWHRPQEIARVLKTNMRAEADQ